MKQFEFQNKKQKDYFEGWYFRFSDIENHVNFAVIFAVTKNTKDPHSFIQIFDAPNNQAYYYRYPVDAFSFQYDAQEIIIDQNLLSLNKLVLKTDDFQFQVNVNDKEFLERYKGSQSAMGFLEDAPLECFQEVLLMDGSCTYHVNHNDLSTSGNGKCYMEKTYGNNFPKKWIWLQSNHSTKGSKISFSVGLIPILFFRVKGFFLILSYAGKEKRYTSYNLSRIRVKQISDHLVELIIKKGKTKVIIEAKQNSTVKLVGPLKSGFMALDVFESIDSAASIKIYEKRKLVFEDQFELVGFELMYN